MKERRIGEAFMTKDSYKTSLQVYFIGVGEKIEMFAIFF